MSRSTDARGRVPSGFEPSRRTGAGWPQRITTSTRAVSVRGGALGVLSLCSACQTYSAEPLDLLAHARTFELRDWPTAELHMQDSASTDRSFDLTSDVSALEAEAVALVFNPDLQAARAQAGVTRASAEQAGRWEDPTLGFDFARIVDGALGPWSAFGELDLTLPLSGRLGVERSRADAAALVDLLRVVEQEWHKRMEVRGNWTRWTAATRRADAARERVERLDALVADVMRLVASDQVSRPEGRLVELELATSQIELAEQDAERQARWLELVGSMGLPSRPESTPQGEMILAPSIALGDGALHTTRLATANPHSLVATATYELAERTLQLELRKQYPDLSLAPGFGREDGDDEVTLGVALPVPLFAANRRAIAGARAERDLARTEAESTIEQLHTALARAEQRFSAVRARRSLLTETMQPLLDAQAADTNRLIELGELPTLVLLESVGRGYDAVLLAIDLAEQQALAAIAIDELLGPDPKDQPHAPESLSFDDTP